MAKNKNNTVKVNNTTVPANPEAENKNTTVKNTKNARIFVSGRTITIDGTRQKHDIDRIWKKTSNPVPRGSY